MINTVVISESAQKDLRKCPPQVRNKLLAWAGAVKRDGLAEVRKQPGYHDEPLRYSRSGQRSIRLNQAYRAFYVLRETELVVEVIEVNKHNY